MNLRIARGAIQYFKSQAVHTLNVRWWRGGGSNDACRASTNGRPGPWIGVRKCSYLSTDSNDGNATSTKGPDTLTVPLLE